MIKPACYIKIMKISKALSYVAPTRIFIGIDAHKKLDDILGEWQIKNLLLLSDHGVADTGFFSQVNAVLKAAGARYDIFTEIEPEPSDNTVEKAFAVFKAIKPPLILAVGGGSTIDVAKAVGILATNKGPIHRYAGTRTFANPPVPLIVIPTTAGTGSELSHSCVISDSVSGLKMSIRNAVLNRPKVAILDPLGLNTLPANAAAHAAMDAFVHALESYVSLNANPITDAVNLHAIELIAANIRPFVSNRSNLQAGINMLCAASLAAMGFSNTGVGNVHCMARFVGAFFHVSHGLANAVCLPHAARFNLQANPEKFARVAAAMGEITHGLTAMEAGKLAIAAMRQLNMDLGIPKRLRDIGVSKDKIPEMAQLAFQADYNCWNPRYTSAEDFEMLFKQAY
jgi:alcohol dehydrogenase